MNIELIYDAACPNVEAARSALIGALAKTRMSARWEEWERNAPGSPWYTRRFGSPTILIDGKDIAGTKSDDGEPSCRLHCADNGRLMRTPSHTPRR
jgi:mercuric ion transport protein